MSTSRGCDARRCYLLAERTLSDPDFSLSALLIAETVEVLIAIGRDYLADR